jgi:hypothetical protein
VPPENSVRSNIGLLIKTRARLEAENLVLRQAATRPEPQVAGASKSADHRSLAVGCTDSFRRSLDAIIIVKPETVIRWHRLGFRAYWRWKSRRRSGRPSISRELGDLIRRISRENPLWGAPRIHAELLLLGIDIAESAVGRYRTGGGNHRHRVGRPFCAITPPVSLRSIFSWCERSRSTCSMAW